MFIIIIPTVLIIVNLSGGISVMRQSKGGLITGQSLAWAAPAYHLRPRGWVEFAQNLIVWESDRSWESDHLWESDLTEIISWLIGQLGRVCSESDHLGI